MLAFLFAIKRPNLLGCLGLLDCFGLLYFDRRIGNEK